MVEAAGIALRAAAGLGSIYLILCVFLWAIQDKLIFHPQPLLTLPNHPQAVPVAIDRGEVVLRGWVVNEAAPGAVVVYFGGNAEEVSVQVNAFAERAATTVLVNYRGYGESEGRPSEQALVEDAVAIAAWARRRFADRPLVLFGSSLGTGVAALAAPKVRPDAVILSSPYRSVENIARATFPIFPVRWMLRHPFRAETAAPHLPRTLVFASPTDRVIPFVESEAMAGLLGERGQLHVFDLPHNAFLAHPSIWQVVDDFLAWVGDEAAPAA